MGTSAGDTSKHYWQSLLAILALGWLVRSAVILLLPAGAHSLDFDAFALIASIVGTGENPYSTTSKLNWPPFLMQIVFVIDGVADALHVPFIDALRLFLIAVESLVIIATARLIQLVAPESNWRRMLVFGFALNPIPILLVCQHGTMDPVAVLFMVVTCIFVIRYERSGDVADWLIACSTLGLGILTKTYPLILCPLLVPGFRRTRWKERFIEGFLLLWTVIIGLSAIYVIDPERVRYNVLDYEAIPGFFGITGLAHVLDLTGLWNVWGLVAKLGIIGTMLGLSLRAWQKGQFSEPKVILVTALLLLGVPTLGPGFGTQYAIWSLPFFITTWPLFGRLWQRTLLGGVVISVASYLVIYALVDTHGMALTRAFPGVPLSSWTKLVSSQEGQTFTLLPMFLSWLLLLVLGVAIANRTEPIARDAD